jgi:hypothetical protein
MPRRLSCLPLFALALSRCGDAEPDPTPDTVGDAETVETVETIDTPEAPDTVPGDTPVDESDPPDTIDTPPIPSPPTSWGGGLVDISGPLLTTDAYEVSVGSREDRFEPDTISTSWTDLDGDHTPEILFTTRTWSTPRPTDFRVYRWVNGEIVRAPELEARLPRLQSSVLLAVDLDTDGLAELVQAHGEALFWSEGAGWAPPLGLGEGEERRAFWNSVAPWDFDHDGRTDLLTGDGLCNTTITPFLQDELGAVTRHPEVLPSANGAGARPDSVLPFELPDGRTVMVGVGMNCDLTRPHPGFLVEDATDAGTYSADDLLPPNTYMKLMPPWAGFPFTAWAPMGASVTDLDNDGVLDLVLSLGFRWLIVLQGMPDGTFVDQTPTADLEGRDREWGTTEITWSLAHPDLDKDGRPEVLVTIGDDSTSFHLQDGMTVGNRAWWNAGSFHFADIDAAIGFDFQGGWKTLAMADPDRDGDADMLVGGHGVLPRVLRNDIDTGNHGFSLVLHGNLSNPTGLGAKVEVEVNGLPTQLGMMGNEGNCGGASPPILFFGTGSATDVDLVRVRWPSGYVQELRGLGTDTMHEVTEPTLAQIFPPGRKLAADGRSTAEVHLKAYDEAGVVDPNAVLGLELIGAGTISQPPTWTGTDYVARVQAPSAPGRATLVITVDGAPWRIRPQIAWGP